MLGRCVFRLLLLFGRADRPFCCGLRPCSFVDPLRSVGLGCSSLRHAPFLANAICRVKEAGRRAAVMDTMDKRGNQGLVLLPLPFRHRVAN